MDKKETALEMWQENPKITGAELNRKLNKKGFTVHKSTAYLWLKGFRKEAMVTLEKIELTLEQVIQAAGSVETLSLLFYQGVMKELTKKDAAYHLLKQECVSKDNKISSLKRELDEVTRERNRMMREYNEKMAKVKVGTLTLDESMHRLIPKS